MPTETPTKPRGAYRKHLVRSRANLPPLKIHGRHIAIMRSLDTDRLSTFSLLTQLFPPSEKARRTRFENPSDTTHTSLRRVLRSLFHHGYLDRLAREDVNEYIYALAPKGAQFLTDRQLPLAITVSTLANNRDLSSFNARHALMVARFHTALVLALRTHPTLSLYSFDRESKDLKVEWKSQSKRLYINPDAYFVLEDTKDKKNVLRLPFFLEADRSTMTQKRLMDKYLYYSRMYAEGVHQAAFDIKTFRVLTVTKSPERAANVLQLISDDEYSPIPKQIRGLFCFTTEATYNNTPSKQQDATGKIKTYQNPPQNVLAEIWRKADNIEIPRGIIPSPLPRL